MTTQTAAVTRLATALATALGAPWRPAASTDPERRTAFVLHTETGSWVLALTDPEGKQLALAAARPGHPPRQATTFKPDLDENTSLYDWLTSVDLTGPAKAMATAALAALGSADPGPQPQ
ncbi:hypothetical protein [Streptomyces sp. NPDC059215]|uniref:hypothetical protein n=1 Tax=Streptomyces sp. NPDC059215 TaxID=3346772 RepID=UPI00367B60AA